MIREELSNAGTTLLVVVAMLTGAVLGLISDTVGDRLERLIDVTVLALVIVLIIDVRLVAIPKLEHAWRFWIAVLGANFLVIPLIGFAIASLGFPDNAAIATGLAIYFMAPCTDWFLGFTRLAKGNAALGAALLPINLAIQLALLPLYLKLFAGWRGDIDIAFGETLFTWFAVPFAIAFIARFLLRRLAPVESSERVTGRIATLSPVVLAMLVVEIFAANVAVIERNLTLFGRVLGLVFVFFVITYALGEALARRLRFAYPEHALFTMTTAARNAPLMLGVTATLWADEPLLSAAIVTGMLVEFPHLTVLKHLLLRRHRLLPPEPPAPAPALEPLLQGGGVD